MLGLAAPCAGFEARLDVSLRPEFVYQAPSRSSPLNPGGRVISVVEQSGQETTDVRLHVALADPVELIVRDRWFVVADGTGVESQNLLEDAFILVRPSPRFQLVAGKDRVREGVGYAWSPVDFLRTRIQTIGVTDDPRDRRDHRPGHYLVKAEARRGARALAVLWAPAFDGLDTGGVSNTVEQIWARYSDLLVGTDLNLYLYHGEQWKGGLSAAHVLGEALEIHGEVTFQHGHPDQVPSLLTVGGGASGPVRVPVWEERWAAGLTVVALLGAQYTFPGGINVIAEYFLNGAGWSPARWASVFAAAGLAGAELRTGAGTAGGVDFPRIFLLRANGIIQPGEQGRHYLFTRVAGARLAAFTVLNLEDGSGVVSAEVRWPLGRRVDGRLGVDVLHGAPRSEFGSLPVSHIVRAGLQIVF
jgi:hypothetical protein